MRIPSCKDQRRISLSTRTRENKLRQSSLFQGGQNIAVHYVKNIFGIIYNWDVNGISEKKMLRRLTLVFLLGSSRKMEICVPFTVWHHLHQFQAFHSLHIFTRMTVS